MNELNLEQLKELLFRVRANSPAPEVLRLIESLEAFIELYAGRNQQYTGKQEFAAKLHTSYKNLWEAFDAAAAPYGLSHKGIQNHLQNQMHFTAEEWHDMETMKQEISAIEKPAAQRPAHKKLKKNKKNVRI